MKPSRTLAALLLAAPAVLFSACNSVNNDPDPVRRAFVTRVTIDDFPFLNPANGDGWDSSGPDDNEADLYFRLLGTGDAELLSGDGGGENEDLIDSGNGVQENQGPGEVPVVFNVANYEINVLERVLVVQVKDDDSDEFPPGSDSDIGRSESFRLLDFAPATTDGTDTEAIPFESADGAITGRITVRWAN
jgi:hypothetical protein